MIIAMPLIIGLVADIDDGCRGWHRVWLQRWLVVIVDSYAQSVDEKSKIKHRNYIKTLFNILPIKIYFEQINTSQI